MEDPQGTVQEIKINYGDKWYLHKPESVSEKSGL